MTASRIVRTKGKLVVILAGVFLVAGFMAFYNSTRLQLEEIHKSNDLCHQQQENLSTQLQVIFDYKQRLEKSLKTEKAEHHQAKTDFENRFNQQKQACDKATNEAKLQYSSLQQHYNILQTEFTDYKEESSKTHKENLDEINQLQSKLAEVQEQFKKSENEYRNNVEHLKTQIKQLEADKTKLSEQVSGGDNHLLEENKKLLSQIEKLQNEKHSSNKQEILHESSSRRFEQQIPVGSNEYEIKVDSEREKADNNSLPVIANPLGANKNAMSSSTKSSISSKANMAIQPLKEPSASPETIKKESSPKSPMELNVMPQPAIRNNEKKLPEGVVPIPNKIFDANSKQQSAQKAQEEDKNDIPPEIVAALPGRYRNNIIDNENNHIDKNDKEEKALNEEKDTAQEVYDIPELNKEHNIHEESKDDKHHIDELGLGEKENVPAAAGKAYDGDGDPEVPNDMLEEDDEDDYPNGQKEQAVRN